MIVWLTQKNEINYIVCSYGRSTKLLIQNVCFAGSQSPGKEQGAWLKEEWIEDVVTRENDNGIDIAWHEAYIKEEPCSDVEEEPSRSSTDETENTEEVIASQKQNQGSHFDNGRKSKANFDRQNYEFENYEQDPKSFECNLCDYRGITKSLLKNHISRVHEKEKRHACRACGRKFFHKPHLMRHMMTHTGEKIYACDECQARFTQKKNLEKHSCKLSRNKRSGIHKKNFHACDICDFTSNRPSHLESHMRLHTNKVYTCYVCSYTCSKRNTLKAHVIGHRQELPFCCSKCSYKGAKEYDLKWHIRIHTEKKRFACDKCDFRTNTSSNMHVHVRRKHTEEKPYACKDCEYKCTSKSDLKRHEATHTGKKLFVCDYCDYKCHRSDVLMNHIRTHTGEKPYVCHICSYACSLLANLKQHKRVFHGNGKPKKVMKTRRK